jgi:AcrR family transcriptional regulator
VTTDTRSKAQRGKRRRRLTRQEKREANRDLILQAARKVFGERGFHAATVEQIADEAGLSNGAIYYNFESKADLFFALMKERQDERIRHLRGAPGGRAGEGRAADLQAEARDATRTLKESPEWRLLLFEFAAHAARHPRLARELREHKRAFRSALTEALRERLAQQGSAPTLEADRLALIATALTNGLAFEEIADPGSVPDDLLSDLLGLLLSS